MHVFAIRVAGLVVEISTTYAHTPAKCRDFVVEQTRPDLRITSRQDDIDATRRAHEANGVSVVPCDGILELATVQRKLANELVAYDTIAMHGAVVAVGDAAYLFTAPSGTGKTTHIKRWLEACPDAYPVNGDKPFVRIADDGTPLVCGSPWAGKEGMYTNAIVPLKAIVLMERASENRMDRISFVEAFPPLLEQVYRPDDADKARKVLQLVRRLDPAVSFWRFRFDNFREDCFQVAHDALRGKA